MPTVLVSTLDLIARLDRFNSRPGCAADVRYIVSMDVTALYPNLDVDLHLNEMKEWLPEFVFSYLGYLFPNPYLAYDTKDLIFYYH